MCSESALLAGLRASAWALVVASPVLALGVVRGGRRAEGAAAHLEQRAWRSGGRRWCVWWIWARRAGRRPRRWCDT